MKMKLVDDIIYDVYKCFGLSYYNYTQGVFLVRYYVNNILPKSAATEKKPDFRVRVSWSKEMLSLLAEMIKALTI